jgi:hypothetical protein
MYDTLFPVLKATPFYFGTVSKYVNEKLGPNSISDIPGR